MARSIRWSLLMPMAMIWIAAHAAGWDSIWQRVDSWPGPRTVALSSNLEQPYGAKAYRRLVNGLTERGFTVVPAAGATVGQKGLIAQLLETKTGLVVALSRADDHAILLVEPVADGGNYDKPRGFSTETSPVSSRRISLAGHPKQIAVFTSSSDEGLDLALLYDDRLERISVEGEGIVTQSRFASGVKASKSLYVGTGRLDADPAEEVAVVWGQDRDIAGKGTSTKLFGRILEESDGELRAESPPLDAYLRIIDDSAFAQRRSQFETYSGPVLRLAASSDGFALGSAVPDWRGTWLYDLTSIGRGLAAAWIDEEQLALLDMSAQGLVLRSAIGELGEVLYPRVAVRLRERIVITDPDPSASVTERYVPLPRRVISGKQGAIYTIERGRASRLAGLFEPSGQDRVVRLVATTKGLRRERPLPALDRYILDFALVARRHGSVVVLLTNENPDGSGQANLVIQRMSDS